MSIFKSFGKEPQRHRVVGSTKIRSSEDHLLVAEVLRQKRLNALNNWEIIHG